MERGILIGIIIGILIYSLINLIFLFYKYKYYSVETEDYIIAGPICWLWILAMQIIGHIMVIFKIPFKKKKYKNKSDKYIQKIVKKVMELYVTRKKAASYIFDFTSWNYDTQWSIAGVSTLTPCISSPKDRRLNDKLETLYRNQKQDVIKELMKYFEPVSGKDLKEYGYTNLYRTDGCFYNKNYRGKDFSLYKLKVA